MKRMFLLTSALLFSHLALADIKLDVHLFMGDSEVKDQFVLQEGESNSIGFGDMLFEFTASLSEENEVLVDVIISKEEQDGTLVLISKPTLKVVWETPAEIKIESDEELPLDLVVTAYQV